MTERLTILAQHLVTLRKAAGKTQVQFAKEAGISLRTLQEIESGKSDPKLSVFQKACDVLQISSVDLMYALETGILLSRTKTSAQQPSRLQLTMPFSRLDQLQAGLCFIETDGLLLYINLHAAHLLGCSRQEIVGRMYVWDFLADESKRQELMQEFAGVIREPASARAPLFLEAKRKDGVPVSLRLEVSNLKNSAGAPEAFFAAISVNSH